MRYSREFFAFQIEFTQKLAAKFGGDYRDYLFDYTTFSKSLGIDSPGDATSPVWQEYLAGLQSVTAAGNWTYEFYLAHNGRHDGLPYGDTFHGRPLFGCFYCEIREGRAVRPHFIKNDASEHGPLSRERMGVRRNELRRMFQDVLMQHPEIDCVVGSSWLYNLEAYRRLFPSEFTTRLERSESDEFQFLVRWGQFFDKEWRVKPALAHALFANLENLAALEELRNCFPYPILRAGCSLDFFTIFYGIEAA